MKFAVPFKVKNGIIYDRNEEKVKLWGVNYYVPFNHNYYNIAELGMDHFAAIDEDIRHFKMMGVDLIRMHLYEREITDRNGHIVENHNMKVFDYFVDQCEKNNIYLMLTPITWWNSINNQIFQERYYAYWYIDSQEAFGFTNFYSCDSMLWDLDAIKCQQIYLEDLFSRPNSQSEKKLHEYSNIIVLELFNEPAYLERWMFEQDIELNSSSMGLAKLSRGSQRQKIIKMWSDFQKTFPEGYDEDKCFSLFRVSIMKNYFDSLIPIVEKYFEDRVLRAQFSSYRGTLPEDLVETFKQAGIDAYTLSTYLNANQFEAENTNSYNHLKMAKEWFESFANIDFGEFAKISYEFNATATQNGYPLAAIAAMYAQYDVQIASYFTYTPAAIAAWNPGWLVHYLNLAHTPSRAAAFAVAGEIFRNHTADAMPVKMDDDVWSGSNFSIERENDFVYFKSETIFRYSNNNTIALGDASKLTLVSGCGSSLFASSSANSFYLLEKITDTQWRLTIFPDQQFICAPERAKTYRAMANRYVNCLKESPVSILKEDKIDFCLKVFSIINAEDANTAKRIEVNIDNKIRIAAGIYNLEVQSCLNCQ